MNFKVRETAEETVVYLSGDLVLGSSDEVEKVLLDQVAKSNGKTVVADFTQVRILDSSGLASLVKTLKVSRDKGVEFVLSGVQRSAQEVLKLSRLQSIFTIRDSPGETP